MLRAAHQLIDGQPKILDDPISIGLVEEATPERIAARRAALLSPKLMVPRAAVVLRSRYAEDLLAQAAGRRVTQFVVLGAGLDTFAYRQPAFARGFKSMRLIIRRRKHGSKSGWPQRILRCPIISIGLQSIWSIRTF